VIKTNEIMKKIEFPVKLTFNVSTLSNDFVAKDANARTIGYVKQKLFKLKEAITFYADETKQDITYTINADKWIDFSAAYSIKDAQGIELGKVARKGWASIWKASYELIDQHQQHQFSIREANGWVKVMDSLFGEIPILGMFTGYLFNPTYLVTNLDGKLMAKLKKDPSFFGRKFTITAIEKFDEDDSERIILGLMMMILLERRRG